MNCVCDGNQLDALHDLLLLIFPMILLYFLQMLLFVMMSVHSIHLMLPWCAFLEDIGCTRVSVEDRFADLSVLVHIDACSLCFHKD